MECKFLNDSFDKNSVILPSSDKIHPLLLKNNKSEILKGLEFLAAEGNFLYIHGFLGTGKRQIVNYISDFVNKDVIILEYYCKPSTVCDDILLSFIDKIERNNLAKVVNTNVKISTLAVKFQQYLSAIKKPFLIIIHSFDDLLPENINLIKDTLIQTINNQNVKLILTTKAMLQDVLNETKYQKKLFIKAFTKEIFKEYLDLNNINCNEKFLEEFYKYTRGYYYYTALSVKIIGAMKLSLSEFIEKFKLSGMTFDTYLGVTYINLIPQAIRNFFWFIRLVRHGLSINALANLDLYDEFSVSYLKTNLMIYEADEIIYIQDYFQQNIDISIPRKTEIKLHKYIISIYEKELKEQLQNRSIYISRQAMRAEIKYHNDCIEALTKTETNNKNSDEIVEQQKNETSEKNPEPVITESLEAKLKEAAKYQENGNNTKAIETYQNIIETETLDTRILNDVRHQLAIVYREIGDYSKSQHYYELVEKYYKYNNELINLNYLYFELAGLYYLMYKTERAIETIKKVIYSVDTPQSLMVEACTKLGNMYGELNDSQEAYVYYQKALESLEENTSAEALAELYFKYALANDERGNLEEAFEYYTKCLTLGNNSYTASAYSNLGSCYFENDNISDAKSCFKKAYEIEKASNNYDGIFYTSMNLAKISITEKSHDALEYLKDAKQSAEYINDDNYILQAAIALGDYYYNNPQYNKEALSEYMQAKTAAYNISGIDISKIEKRIEDMRLRMNPQDFSIIEKQYEK